MLIPLLPKDPTRNNFTCRDGEIEFDISITSIADAPAGLQSLSTAEAGLSLTPTGNYPTANIRIPPQTGDKPKAELLLSGEITRVDPATAERLTQAIVQRAAETMLDLSTDLRRQGLFILPFRAYTMTMREDGTMSMPTAQAIALPTDFPPHPEITAAGVTEDAMTLSIRFPVRPHRLTLNPSPGIPAANSLRIFISYRLYIPDPNEMRGSIGSVRSVKGGTNTGIRFAFLSSSAIKASVAAPEKYYELVGNERTGYRLSSKAATLPDYSCYAPIYGYTPPFPRESLIAPGADVGPETGPLDWIANWCKAGEGYLPASLPYKYWVSGSDGASAAVWPEGIDEETAKGEAATLATANILLTRPMAFSSDSQSRRNATPRAIRTIRVLGLPAATAAHAILYGSDDCIRWTPLRRFDPRYESHILTPPRLFHRLLLYYNNAPHPQSLSLSLLLSLTPTP